MSSAPTSACVSSSCGYMAPLNSSLQNHRRGMRAREKLSTMIPPFTEADTHSENNGALRCSVSLRTFLAGCPAFELVKIVGERLCEREP